jgi:hypothetical protein
MLLTNRLLKHSSDYILKVVKVLCFDRLLYVFILKELWGLRFGAFLAGKKGRISCD